MRISLAFFVFTVCSVASAISEGNSYIYPYDKYQFDKPGLYVKNSVSSTNNIKVCWLRSTQDQLINGNSALITTETIITNEYRRAGINVSGWDFCKEEQASEEIIRIIVEDNQPRVSSIGCTQPSDWCIRINFDFLKWPSSCSSKNWDKAWACYCHLNDYREVCIKSYALHEFGHVLGLAHEAEHSGSTCDDKTTSQDVVEIGKYDPLSIMNYCSNKNLYLYNNSLHKSF